MLKGGDPHLERFHGAEKGEDLILTIAMTVNEPDAGQDFRERFKLKIAAGRGTGATVAFPGSAIGGSSALPTIAGGAGVSVGPAG